MITVTIDQLKAIATGGIITPQVVDALNQTISVYGIGTSAKGVAYFLAQLMHESNQLQSLRENLNYGAAGLMKTFPSQFPNQTIANQYARNPIKIGNRAYANRNGNGNEASGDGYNYRGGGGIQTTGRANFQQFQNSLVKLFPKVNIVQTPDLITTMPYALLSAGFFWQVNNLNRFVLANDFLGLSQRINGSGRNTPNGWDDRQAWLKKIVPLIK